VGRGNNADCFVMLTGDLCVILLQPTQNCNFDKKSGFFFDIEDRLVWKRRLIIFGK